MFDALQWTELLWGAGAVALAVVIVVLWSGRPAWLDAGLAGAAAIVVALFVMSEVTLFAPIGVLVVAGTAILGDGVDLWRRLGLFVIGGGLVLVDIGFDAGTRLLVAAVVAALIAWVLATDFGRHQQSVTLLVVLAGSAAGIYANVPDTEAIAVVLGGLGVLAGVAVLAALVGHADRVVVGAPALVVLLAAIFGSGADGARGRDVAFIGVVGVLGVLVSHALARALRPRAHSHPVVLVIVHAIIVLVVSRLTIDEAATDARTIVLLALVAALPLVAIARNADVP